ncbi:uncharacterized protein TNCV_4108231 [Trichonephila clavipes]|nr:uncharacterized protein TNCV_4108231 [Trichonephila clavipes]
MTTVRRILYKGTLARCNRLCRIDEADITTHVAVDQRVSNCLEESAPPCGASVDRHALTSPSVIHSQFFELFGARRSTASKLVSLWNCSAIRPPITGQENPPPFKLSGGIIGPYFFKNDEGHNVTVDGDRYRAMITNFFIPELNNHDVQELWFQQDGATCHTARATIDLLKDTFGGRLISRFGPVNWPPRSCDLTPRDYFLWGYVKSLVYADKTQMLDHLEDNIRRVIADLDVQIRLQPSQPWQSYARNHI